METQIASNRAAGAREFSLDTIDIVGPDHYQKNGYPHAEWTYLRKHKPVFHVVHPRTDPFWAITKAADITEISKQPRLWLNGPRIAIFVLAPGEEALPPEALPLKHLLNMDPPEHGEFRRLLSSYFTPRSVRALEPQVAQITREVLDDAMGRSECDFVTDISSKVPVAVIAEMLGVPREDWPRLFRWTNEIIGGGDPEFQREGNPNETFAQARMEVFNYFTNLVAERQKQPRNDVTSILANAKVNGAPLPPLELLSYLLVLVVAGNETTRNATTGGLLAMIEHPREFQRLRCRSRDSQTRDRGNRPMDLAGHPVRAYRDAGHGSARTGDSKPENRSACSIRQRTATKTFSTSRSSSISGATRIRIWRSESASISASDANLARLELEVIFRELAKRLEFAEQAGPVERLRSSFVGGIKHMPIRYKLNAA